MKSIKDVEVVVPHLKTRATGVTTTVVHLVPTLSERVAIATLGPGLPKHFPRMRWRELAGLMRKPRTRPFRIWHARRNNEMLLGLVMRDLLRAPLKLVFTSDAQRTHRRFTKWMLRRMDGIIAGSRQAAGYLEVPYSIVSHGVDGEVFHPSRPGDSSSDATGFPGRRIIGCFGRIRRQKGTDLFVEAAMELLPKHPEWTAVIAGRVTGEHRQFQQSLMSKITKAGLEDRIVFLGEVPDIAKWYRRIDLLVAPSRVEGFGLTPLEAMASGTPVVASDAGAYVDMVQVGATGAIVPAGDGEALTAAIRDYMETDGLVAAHGRAALDRVAQLFPLGREAEGIMQVYEQLWSNAG